MNNMENNLETIFIQTIQTIDKDMQQEFLDYWTEKNPGGKKERWQMEKVFDVKRRWGTWTRNAKKFNKEFVPAQKPKDEKRLKEFHDHYGNNIDPLP